MTTIVWFSGFDGLLVGAGNPPTDPGRFARARVGWEVVSFWALRNIGFSRVLHLFLSDKAGLGVVW